jgi:hypothetical protein
MKFKACIQGDYVLNFETVKSERDPGKKNARL